MSGEKTNHSKNESEEDMTTEEDRAGNTDFLMNSMRKNMLGAWIFQLLYPVLIIGLIWIIANVLRLDLIHPYISLGNAPILLTVAYIMLSLLILQLVYAIIMPLVDGKLIGKILGSIVSIGMLIFPPTGTYFGILLFEYVLKPDADEGKLALATDNMEKESRKGLGNQISFSGLLMLHQPMIMIILNVILLTLPLDMAHPIITSDLYAKWDVFAYAYLGVFLAQILVGVLFKKFGKENWMRAIAMFFAVFMITSFAIAVQALMLKLGPGLELGETSWILSLGWIIGLLLNPLGLYFGIGVIKGLILEKKV